MTRVHQVLFPRWDEDVASGRRTVAHLPVRPEMRPVSVGDEIRLIAGGRIAFRRSGVLTEAGFVRLLDVVDADLTALNAEGRDEYLARWDAIHPGSPSAGDPEVLRIAWRYERDEDSPPEWSLAS